MKRVRIRDLGVKIGELPTGILNAITDVPGVLVGHTTLVSGNGKLIPGKGPVRTGVTVILPHPGNLFKEKVPAAVHTINGFGKVVGFEQVRELGTLESPIALTNTMNVGLVMDALVTYSIQNNPEIGIRTSSVNAVVGETNDGFLNDIQGRHVKQEHVLQAIDSANLDLPLEGAVGAGTGTKCLGWKGGIGTASRIVSVGNDRYILGALVQSNFGRAQDLQIAGVPVGRHILPPKMEKDCAEEKPGDDQGSIMIVLATDAPLDSRQLKRLCRRAVVGLARTGSHIDHGSGDFVIAFSTAHFTERETQIGEKKSKEFPEDSVILWDVFRAVAECVEESILNSMSGADTVVGRDNHTVHGLPLEPVRRFISRYNSI